MKSYAILLIVGLLSARASAASGTVSGYLLFFQNQGNFCPSHKSCTGAKYVESQYQTNMAVQDAKVYIRRASDHVVIGQGISSSTGNFHGQLVRPSDVRQRPSSCDMESRT